MYEGMMHECVLITEMLPERDYYKDIPVIQVKKWKDGLAIARDLIEKPDQLVAMGRASRRFYNRHFAPKTVAKWASKIISERC